MKVVFFHRKPFPYNYSMEVLFEAVRKKLEGKIDYSVVICPHFSQGILDRIKNILAARKHQGDINHITGDVNYVNYLFDTQKTILTIHDLGYLRDISWLKRKVMQWIWLTIPVRKSAAVTVISESTRQDLLRYVSCDPAKIRVIPNFISDAFQFVPREFRQEKPTLLQIGTKFNKNLPRLIQALEGIPCRLEIVGPLTPTLIAQLEDRKIDYHQSTNLSNEEIVQKYTDCDVLTFVSTLEGFGVPIIEAQTIGRPVLTSNLSSMPEVAGEGACLIDPFDPQDIRAGLLKIIQDPHYRRDLVRKGRKNIKRFNANRIAHMYLDLYYELSGISPPKKP